MTFASIAAVYTGIMDQVDANDSVTVSLANFAINYVPIYLDKKKAGLAAVQYDVNQYLDASLDYNNDHAPAIAAQWNEQKSIDTSVMDAGSSAVNAMIENAKSEGQVNETDMQNAIGSQEPINGYLKALVSLIASGLT